MKEQPLTTPLTDDEVTTNKDPATVWTPSVTKVFICSPSSVAFEFYVAFPFEMLFLKIT